MLRVKRVATGRKAEGVRVMSIARVLGAIVLSAGCRTHTTTMDIEHGSPIRESKADQIVRGRTTRAELFEWFGAPHSIFQEGVPLWKAENVGFYSYARNDWLDSVEEGHYAMLYRFGDTSAQTTTKDVLWFRETKHKAKFRSNELLIILDKAEDIVSDIAYRKEVSGQ